jgi:hypothetical protein
MNSQKKKKKSLKKITPTIIGKLGEGAFKAAARPKLHSLHLRLLLKVCRNLAPLCVGL